MTSVLRSGPSRRRCSRGGGTPRRPPPPARSASASRPPRSCGAMTSCASSPIAHDVAGNLEQARAARLRRATLRRSVTARTIDRHRSSLRRAGCWTSRSSKTLAEIDLLDRDRGVPLLEPHLGGPAARADGVDVFRHQREQRLEGRDRHVAGKRELQDVVLVEPAPRPRVTGPSRPARRSRRSSSVSGVTPKANTCPAVALGERGPQAVDRRARRPGDRADRAPSFAPPRRAPARAPGRCARAQGKAASLRPFCRVRSLNQLILIYSWLSGRSSALAGPSCGCRISNPHRTLNARGRPHTTEAGRRRALPRGDRVLRRRRDRRQSARLPGGRAADGDRDPRHVGRGDRRAHRRDGPLRRARWSIRASRARRSTSTAPEASGTRRRSSSRRSPRPAARSCR